MSNPIGVVVIGSLHYDIFLNASHQPSKGEIIIGQNWFPKFGGKGGNQAMAASTLGVPTKIVSAIGDDVFGKYILDKINSSLLNSNFIQIINKEKTGMSVAISDDDGEYSAVVISGANSKINPIILNSSSIWEDSKILMIQNEINEEINILAATKAKKNGLKVCLNPSPLRNLSSDLIKNIDILIVNKIEAEAISKEKISNFDAAKKISSKLNEKYPLVIITLGENGVVFSELNKKPTHLTTKKINVNNTHGAGDVFAGIFCASYALNDDLLTALQLANEKATFHVAK